MNEKRFVPIGVEWTDGFVQDHYDDKDLFSISEVCNLLNQLSDENEQLKKELNIPRDAHFMNRGELIELNHQLAMINNKREKENEQLKQTMQEVAELLSEEVDLFSDKATEHDICAYVELKELDNKDAYYMAISTKKAIKMLKGDVE